MIKLIKMIKLIINNITLAMINTNKHNMITYNMKNHTKTVNNNYLQGITI
jgi:hypothetical protein